VHFLIGYTEPTHIAPALLGAVQFAIGLTLSAPRMLSARHVVVSNLALSRQMERSG
jgi:hypothetical protein